MALKASTIYTRQNTALHKGFGSLLLPYALNKAFWCDLMRDLCGRRTINSLKDLTLFERRKLIGHLRKRGAKVFNPAVPKDLGHWRKGDPEKVYYQPTEKGYPGRPHNMDDDGKKPLLSRIEAHLTDTKRPWSYADSMAKHMFKIEKIAWCNEGQLYKIVQALEMDARRHGRQY